MNSLIARAIEELNTLFEDQLADVAFPNVDREVLRDLQSEVDTAKEEVLRCEEALDAANRVLSAHEDTLIKTAILAQQYARIFAGEDAELLAQVDAIELVSKPAKKVRKPRKKKVAAAPALQFDDDTSAAA